MKYSGAKHLVIPQASLAAASIKDLALLHECSRGVRTRTSLLSVPVPRRGVSTPLEAILRARSRRSAVEEMDSSYRLRGEVATRLAECCYLRLEVGGEEDVGGLDVSVDDPSLASLV